MITNDNTSSSSTVLTHSSLVLLTWARILTGVVVPSSSQHRMRCSSR